MGPLLPPLVWAQAGSGSPNSLVLLVPRRWYSSLSLSSPGAVPGLHALWAFLAAMGVLLLACLVLQGPRKAIGQLFDIPGHFRLFARSTTRLQRSSRIVITIIGFAVLSWTASQALTFKQDLGKEDLVALLKARSHLELGVEQGMHGLLTPFRDIAGLGDNLPLLLVMTFFLFRAASDPWEQMTHQGRTANRAKVFDGSARSVTFRIFLLCGCMALYALYRLIGRVMSNAGLPIGGCLVLEVVLIPAMMLICDGFLLSWVLAGLRHSEFGIGKEHEGAGSIARAIGLMPAGMLVCASALPARYIATFALLLMLGHLPASVTSTAFGRYLRWQLGPGLADVQAAGLVFAGVAGVVAWSRGTIRGIFRGWIRLITAEGGRVVAVLAMTGAASGVLTTIPYLLLLLLPVQTWVLAAADSYSHYLTIPVALWGLSALIELGRSALPVALDATTDAPAQEAMDLEGRTEPVAS